MPSDRIYLSIPHMSGYEQRFVAEAFSSNWLSSVGPNLDKFEEEMATYLGNDVRTLAVSSGTAALHLILRYLGIGLGDRVAVSTLTFAGSVFPILYLGATPVFVDSERVSGNIDPELLREYLSAASKTGALPKAVVAVHLYGQHCDIDAVANACAEYEIPLVEDSAESLGATYKNRMTGVTGRFAILSFNGNKVITTTGGGMVVGTEEGALAQMKKWANQSRERSVEYLHREIGYNYRMSNVLAGIGRGQLLVLKQRVEARSAVAEHYRTAFSDLEGVELQAVAPWGTHSRWLSVVFLDAERVPKTPAEIVRDLEAKNIEARPVWRPMHTQPVFANSPTFGGSVAQSLYDTGLCLPSSSSLTREAQDRVVSAVREAVSVPGARHTR